MNANVTDFSMPALNRLIRQLRLFSPVRGWKRMVRDLTGPEKFTEEAVVTIGAYGKKMIAHLDSYIEWNIYHFGGYEQKRINHFRNFVKGDGVLLDIGANVGNHSIALSDRFKDIYSFEPNPLIFERLVKNLELNGLDNIHAVNSGLGNRQGSLKFYQPGPGEPNKGLGTFEKGEASPKSIEMELPVQIGDDFVEQNLPGERVAAIKIDVQGFEPYVMNGLRKTIERHKPVIWFEVSDSTRRNLAAFPFPDTATVRKFHAFRKLGVIATEELRPSGLEEISRVNGDYLISFGS